MLTHRVRRFMLPALVLGLLAPSTAVAASPAVQLQPQVLRGTTVTPVERVAAIRTFTHTRLGQRVVLFRVNGVRQARIRRAHLRVGVRRFSIRVRQLRRALSVSPQIRVRTDRRLRAAAAARRPGKKRPIKLVVVETAPAPTTQQPAPVTPVTAPTPAPAPTAPAATPLNVPSDRLGRPTGMWRPYSDDSPFNRPVGTARVAPNSDAMVAEVLSHGPADSLLTIDGTGSSPSADYSRPIYWSKPTDPEYTITCTRYGGDCPISGDRVRIPAQARSAGGTDGHLTVIDPATKQELSFFAVESKPAGGGELRVGWGRACQIDGDGTRCGGGAAEFGGLAGRIRPEELFEAIRNGTGVNHALFMTVNCSRPGTYIWPATKDEPGGGCDSANAPEMGRRFYLDMTPQEIEALDIPEWRKVVVRTMATYGAYVGDQGGSSFGFQFESGQSFLALGEENPFVAYAKQNPAGTVADGGVYYYRLRDGIPWSTRLRALEPTQR